MEELGLIKEAAKLGGGYVIAILALYWSNKREGRLQDIICKQSEANSKLAEKLGVHYATHKTD